MKRLILIIALLLLAPLGFAQTLILSTANGNWSSTATWAGGVVPGDGDFVVVKHNVTINQNIGTVGGGGVNTIRQELGTLNSDGNAHTITFNSTGTNPIGSGIEANPGADATMMGFFVSKGTSFDLEGTAGNALTIQSANGTSPVYIHHLYGDYTGCTSFTANVCNGSAGNNMIPVTMKYVSMGPVIGTASAGYEGIHFEYSGGTGSLDLEHNQLTGLNQVYVSGGQTTGIVTISNNSFVNPVNQYTIETTTPGTPSWVVTNNTETGSATSGSFVYCLNGCTTMTFTGNTVEGTSSVTRGLLFLNASTGGGHTINGNLCYDPAHAGLSTNCLTYKAAATDLTSTVNNNVIFGGYQTLDFAGTGSPTISNNWIVQHSDANASQGPIITFGSSGQTATNTYTITNNTTWLDTCGASPLLNLFFTSSATYPSWNTEIVNHNTFAGCATSVGTYMTEGITSTSEGIENSVLRNNIGINGAYGFVDGNTNSTWSSTNQFQSSGVHHNLTNNQGTAAYEKLGSTWSVGFDNGTTHHPNALYGDLTVSPNFINSTASPTNFDSFCDGVGTIADLFTNLSYQSTFGGTYNANCSIAKMLAWLQYQFTPMNSQLKNAGAPSDCPASCDVGSQPVYPATTMSIL
jgi:hypothetical protein